MNQLYLPYNNVIYLENFYPQNVIQLLYIKVNFVDQVYFLNIHEMYMCFVLIIH